MVAIAVSILDEPRHPSRSSARHQEYAAARKATAEGDPWPMLEYQAKYHAQPNFTDDEDEIIREKYPTWGAARVARVLRRATRSVYVRASSLGVRSSSGQGKPHRFRWDPDVHEPIVREMHAAGATQAEIAREIGLSTGMVGKWMKRLGLESIKGWKSSMASKRK